MFFFLTISFLFAYLMQWRTVDTFKAELIYGVTWAIIFIVLKRTASIVNLEARQSSLYAVVIVMSLLGVHLMAPFSGLDIHKTNLPPRAASLDQAQVCRFRSVSACRCLQITSFSPQFFLETDVRQCTDRYSSFAGVIFRNKINLEHLLDDIKNPAVAFLVFPENMFEMDKSLEPPEVMDAFYTPSDSCIAYAGDARLCYKEGRL
jgi:hypothetical protein